MKIHRIGVVLAFTVAVGLVSCNQSVIVVKDTPAAVVKDTPAAVVKDNVIMTDSTVTINGLTWMRQNLNIETPDSWCYGDDESNCAKYGRLYTWEAATSACANMGSGWRLPTREDWDNLVTYAGGSSVAGKKLKAKSGWEGNGNGTDDYGFSALPGGYRYSDGDFSDAGYSGRWWSATEDGADDAYYRHMDYKHGNVLENSRDRSNGFSVRCVGVAQAAVVKDTPAAVVKDNVIMTDSTVTINGLTWMRQNLNVETHSWCYEDDKSNCAKYGRLYTLEAAKKACASLGGGWRLPTKQDWDNLVDYAGGKDVAGEKLKSKSGWNDNGNGTDDYGFSAMPGGNLNISGDFINVGDCGFWWSATESGSGKAYGRGMYSVYDNVDEFTDIKNVGFSVRCVED